MKTRWKTWLKDRDRMEICQQDVVKVCDKVPRKRMTKDKLVKLAWRSASAPQRQSLPTMNTTITTSLNPTTTPFPSLQIASNCRCRFTSPSATITTCRGFCRWLSRAQKELNNRQVTLLQYQITLVPVVIYDPPVFDPGT